MLRYFTRPVKQALILTIHSSSNYWVFWYVWKATVCLLYYLNLYSSCSLLKVILVNLRSTFFFDQDVYYPNIQSQFFKIQQKIVLLEIESASETSIILHFFSWLQNSTGIWVELLKFERWPLGKLLLLTIWNQFIYLFFGIYIKE